jgi:hypothetical protein
MSRDVPHEAIVDEIIAADGAKLGLRPANADTAP